MRPMETATDTAYKFGCGRYIQTPGAVARVGAEARRLGTRAYVLCGPTAHALTGAAAEQSLVAADVPCTLEVYAGPCCQEHAEEVAGAALRAGCDVIIGIGGGRILDLAKLVARLAGDLPVMTVPTSSATCAAFTPLSVVYTPEGRTRGSWYFPFEVAAVLVDMDIVGRQPARLLAAGIVDALAKWVEVRHHLARPDMPATEDVRTAACLARQAYDRLLAQARDAYADTQAGVASEAVWNAVYLSIVSAGMVSGTARGAYQSALAHAIYEWARANCTREAAGFLHGEIVGVGLFTQAAYNGDADIADELRAVMRAMGMPVTLAGVGIAADGAFRDRLCGALCATPYVPPGEEAAARARAALDAI